MPRLNTTGVALNAFKPRSVAGLLVWVLGAIFFFFPLGATFLSCLPRRRNNTLKSEEDFPFSSSQALLLSLFRRDDAIPPNILCDGRLRSHLVMRTAIQKTNKLGTGTGEGVSG